MSHEIRTPLNGVLGLAQLLRSSKLNDDQRNKVETILSSGNTLLSIISDVLDMSRIEAGGMELEETAFNLQNLVTTIATPFQSLADDKLIKLKVINNIETDLSLVGDPVRLRQIFWNLLSNAIKFTNNGSVTMKTSLRDPAEERLTDVRDHVLCFSVSDTGDGISEDRVDAIFDAFTQADTSITRKFGGTGLGLAIVKQLTEMMGGTIEVTSEVGTGTQFTVLVPFRTATAEEASLLSAEVETGGKIVASNILVAEDNEINAMIATAFLEQMGHTVKRAVNGLDAIAIAKENWADLILMDVHMPEMDGMEATKIIRAEKLVQTIPIIGLTAEAFAERHIKFVEAGMNAVLTKPFTIEQLSDVLAKFSSSTHVLMNTGSVEDKDQLEPSRENEEVPIGNYKQLEKLRTQMGDSTLAMLLNEAIQSLADLVEETKEGVNQGNSDMVYKAAHTIKGSCGSLCGLRISALAKTLEDNAHDMETVREIIPEFEQTAIETAEWWRDYL